MEQSFSYHIQLLCWGKTRKRNEIEIFKTESLETYLFQQRFNLLVFEI